MGISHPFAAQVLLSIPLMVVYALNLNGGATEMGFSRISIANVWHDGPRSARLWATVAALWASQVAALRLVELHDIRAMGAIYREIAKAPAHHYAAVITGLSEDLRDERRLRTFFESAFRGNVLRVRLVRHLSVDPATAGDGEETGLEALTGKALDFGRAAASTVLGSEGFLRERVADFVTALRAVVKADARALEAAERELSSGPSLLPDALRDSGGARAAGAVADAGKGRLCATKASHSNLVRKLVDPSQLKVIKYVAGAEPRKPRLRGLDPNVPRGEAARAALGSLSIVELKYLAGYVYNLTIPKDSDQLVKLLVDSGMPAVDPRAHGSTAGQEKRAKFPTSKAPISVVFHSFRLIFGRAIISRSVFEAWILSGMRSCGTRTCKRR